MKLVGGGGILPPACAILVSKSLSVGREMAAVRTVLRPSHLANRVDALMHATYVERDDCLSLLREDTFESSGPAPKRVSQPRSAPLFLSPNGGETEGTVLYKK